MITDSHVVNNGMVLDFDTCLLDFDIRVDAFMLTLFIVCETENVKEENISQPVVFSVAPTGRCQRERTRFLCQLLNA